MLSIYEKLDCMISPQHKDASIANFVLAVPFKN